MKPQILFIDDEEDYHIIISRILAEDYDLTMVTSARQAEIMLAAQAYDAVLLDLSLPDTPSARQTLELFHHYARKMPVIPISNHASKEMKMLSFQYGCLTYLVKNKINPDWLKEAIFGAIYVKSIELHHRQQLAEINQTLVAAWQAVMIVILEIITALESVQPLVKKIDKMSNLISKKFEEVGQAVRREPDEAEIERLLKRMGQ